MWLAVMVAVAVLVLILISPVTVQIKYTYCKLDAPGEGAPQEYVPDRGVGISLFWGFLNLRLKLSSVKLVYRAFNPVLKLRARLGKRHGTTLAREKTGLMPGSALSLFKRAVALYQATAPAYRHLLAKTALRRFRWSTGLGLPEAGQTGVVVGFLWIAKSNVTSLLYRQLGRTAPQPELEVLPFFDRQSLRVSFDCIFTLRTGHIIYTGLLAGWHLFKNRRKLRN